MAGTMWYEQTWLLNLRIHPISPKRLTASVCSHASCRAAPRDH